MSLWMSLYCPCAYTVQMPHRQSRKKSTFHFWVFIERTLGGSPVAADSFDISFSSSLVYACEVLCLCVHAYALHLCMLCLCVYTYCAPVCTCLRVAWTRTPSPPAPPRTRDQKVCVLLSGKNLMKGDGVIWPKEHSEPGSKPAPGRVTRITALRKHLCVRGGLSPRKERVELSGITQGCGTPLSYPLHDLFLLLLCSVSGKSYHSSLPLQTPSPNAFLLGSVRDHSPPPLHKNLSKDSAGEWQAEMSEPVREGKYSRQPPASIRLLHICAAWAWGTDPHFLGVDGKNAM